MTDTTDISELPKARVYCTDIDCTDVEWSTGWYYSIEREHPVGPFLSAIEAGRACRDVLITRAEGRTP